MMSERTTFSLTRAEAATLRTAVSYLSESEGNGPDLDALLDKLYRRLDQAVARLDQIGDPANGQVDPANGEGSTCCASAVAAPVSSTTRCALGATEAAWSNS